MSRWYVVTERDDPKPREEVWTLSLYPDRSGWTTDSGTPGYGLTKEMADELAEAANMYHLHKTRIAVLEQYVSELRDHQRRYPYPEDMGK